MLTSNQILKPSTNRLVAMVLRVETFEEALNECHADITFAEMMDWSEELTGFELDARSAGTEAVLAGWTAAKAAAAVVYITTVHNLLDVAMLARLV